MTKEQSLAKLKAWHAANPERVRQKNIRRVRERYEACVAEKICIHCRENDARLGKRACDYIRSLESRIALLEESQEDYTGESPDLDKRITERGKRAQNPSGDPEWLRL